MPCEIVALVPGRGGGLTLVRGFDAPPVCFACGEPPFTALVERVRRAMPTGAPTAKIERYRVGGARSARVRPVGCLDGPGQEGYD